MPAGGPGGGTQRVLSVRTAVPEDAAQVADVHVRSWQVAYRGLFPDEYLDGLRPQDRAARYDFGAADPGRPRTVVAVEHGRICGFATAGACADDPTRRAGELFAIYVDPGRWGRGVGRVLIADARDRLGRDGFLEAVLWVLVGNARAERFYRADGWLPDGQRRREQVWGVTADEIRYRRGLP